MNFKDHWIVLFFGGVLYIEDGFYGLQKKVT